MLPDRPVDAATGAAPDRIAERPDARQAPRAILLHRECAIEAVTGAGARHGLCVIRNLSTTGAMIRTSMDLAVDDPLTLAMASGMRVSGQVRWRRDDCAGVQFDKAVALPDMLARGHAGAAGRPARRLPRLAVAAPARIVDPAGTKRATTCDISTHGARLACDEPIAVGRVTIELPHLPPVHARLLWNTVGQAGCVFDRPFAIEEITDWLRLLAKD